MSAVETVKVKHDDGYQVINKSDFDPKVHTLHKDEDKDAAKDMRSDKEKAIAEEHDARRRFEANRGITGGPAPINTNRNPSGTYSEPTPTDIRYPDKNATEFENNHGAFIGRSAAQLREAAGLPDAPGGLKPMAEIPDDWQSGSLAQRRELVVSLGGQDGMKSADANAFIQAEVDRRAASEQAKVAAPAAEQVPTPLQVSTAATVAEANKK